LFGYYAVISIARKIPHLYGISVTHQGIESGTY